MCLRECLSIAVYRICFLKVDVTTVRWRRFLGPSCSNSLGHDDPVLVSFASAVKRHLVCAWNFEDGAGSLSSPVRRNLWVFWFEEEPALGDVIGPELQGIVAGILLRSECVCPDVSQVDGVWLIYFFFSETEEGSWEKGLTVECMGILFMALRNVLER